MYFYELYGLKAQSNIEFPQLFAHNWDYEHEKADIVITVTDGYELRERFSDVIDRGGNWGITEHGRWFSNQAGVFLLETTENGSVMVCERFEGVPDGMIRSFFLGNCIAIIMTQRKKLVLHGSTIVLNDKTIMVCGDSGAGKSTISMALIDKAGKLMADDISVLDVESNDGKLYALPGFPEQKLCRDAAEDKGYNLEELTYIDENRDKFSVNRSEIFLNEKRKADYLFTLHAVSEENAVGEFENGIKVTEIVGADKVNAITDRFFLIWLYNKSLVLEPSEMMKCIALAGQIRIFDITRIKGLDTKDSIIKSITDLLEMR